MLEVCGTFRRHIPFFNSQLSASPRTCGEVELTIGLPLLAWSNGNTVMLFGYESGTSMKKDLDILRPLRASGRPKSSELPGSSFRLHLLEIKITRDTEGF